MNRGVISMTRKELRRVEVLSRVLRKELTLREAASMMKISYRQAKRIYKRFREEGAQGIAHKQRGQISNRSTAQALKAKILERYQERYSGFGPTLATEKLVEEGFKIDHETLRRWLLQNGLWKKKKAKKAQRQRRQRRPHFGELIQLDGSEHNWFGEEHPKSVLMNMIDDATNTTYSLLAEKECTESAMQVLRAWIERYGVPQGLYTDRHSVYGSSGDSPTQFGRACEELGIELIFAKSPQAKGRVERWNGIYQDRFVKELRLRQIQELSSANIWLQNEFVQELNTKFALEPQSSVNFHRLCPSQKELDHVFSHAETRKLGNDWTVRWKNRIFQLRPEKVGPYPGQAVEVRETAQKQVKIIWQSTLVPSQEIMVSQPKSPTKTIERSSKNPSEKKRQNYRAVKALEKEGLSRRAISRRLGISPNTVKSYLDKGLSAYKRNKERESMLEPFKEMIRKWLNEYPELTATAINKRIQAKGFQGSYCICKKFVAQVRDEIG